MSGFQVGKSRIGASEPCFVIAEIAQAHDGSLGTAHAFIDAAYRAKADAIKFQTHLAHAESTPSEPWRIKFSRQDESRYAYWKRMEFTKAQWHELKKHCDEVDIVFLSSPFSVEAVDLLEEVGVPAWKIGSGEVTNVPLFDRIAQSRKPIFLSTGMSSFSEIDTAVAKIKSASLDFALLQCTSIYPTPAEKVGLNLISEFQNRYQCIVGLSDHSAKAATGLAAAALGMKVLEVHLTLSREMFGPDVSSSITSQELRDLIEGIRWIEKIQSHPVNKDQMALELKPVKDAFEKSLVAKSNLLAGTRLTREHLALKKPGTGIPSKNLEIVVGKILLRDLKEDELLRETDLGENR